MSVVRRVITKHVACNHFDSFGNFCRKCGARKLLLGVGYELGWIESREEVQVECDHAGETGEICTICGDGIREMGE